MIVTILATLAFILAIAACWLAYRVDARRLTDAVDVGTLLHRLRRDLDALDDHANREFQMERGMRRSAQTLVDKQFKALEAGQSYLAAELQHTTWFAEETQRRLQYLESQSPVLGNVAKFKPEQERRSAALDRITTQHTAAIFWGRKLNTTMAAMGRAPHNASALPEAPPTDQLPLESIVNAPAIAG